MRVYKSIKVGRVGPLSNKFIIEIKSEENGWESKSSMKCLYQFGDTIVQTGVTFEPICVYTSWDDFTKRTKESFGIEVELDF